MQVDPNDVIQALGRRIARDAIQQAMMEVAVDQYQTQEAENPPPTDAKADGQ